MYASDCVTNEKKISFWPLVWPLFIENLLRMSLGNVNTFMLSRYSDRTVGAVGVSNQIITMALMIYTIIGSGTTILISQYLGAGKREAARKAVAASIIASLCFGGILSTVLAVFSKQLLHMMNLPEELMEDALIYLIIVGGTSFTQAIMATLSSIFRSYGDAKFPMYVALGMYLANIAANYMIIYRPLGGPIYGVTGIAAAVALSQAAAVVFMLSVMFRREAIALGLRELAFINKTSLKEIFKYGFPSAGDYMSYDASQLVVTCIVAGMGSIEITTRVYILNITYLIWILGSSIGQGTQILIGHMAGSGKFEEAYSTCIKCFKIAILSDTAVALIFGFFGEGILGIFTDDVQIIQLGRILLLMTILIEPGRASNLVVLGALRGAGDVRYPVIMGVLITWLLIVPLTYVLGIYLKLELIGVWIACIADEWGRGFVSLQRWRSRKWQKMSLEK